MPQSSPSAARGAGIAFALLYIAFCLSFIDRSAMALSLKSVGEAFHLNQLEKGTILSSFYLGFALMQLPGGWLADRFGTRPVILATVLAWSIFTMITANAWSFGVLIAIRFAFGLAEGAFPTASMKAMAEFYRGDAKQKMSSLLLSSNYVGSMIAPLILAPLILAVGWRGSFVTVALPGLVLVAAYALAVPRRPRLTAVGDDRPRVAIGALLRMPLLWQLTIAWFGMSCINKGLDAWMPSYLLEARHLDLKTVGLLTPLPYLAAAIATAGGGWVMLRFFAGKEKYLLVLSALLTGIFVFCMYRAQSVGEVIAFQALVYFFKSFTFVTVIALPLKMLSDDRVGTGLGLINAGGQAAGFVAPAVMGLLMQLTASYDAAFGFLVAMTILSLIAALSIGRRSTASPIAAAAA